MVNLDILQHAWTAITELCKETSTQNEGPSSSVKFKVFELPNCTIIAFFTWPANSKDYVQGNGGGDFVTSSTLKDSFRLFNFLCTKTNPSFSINKPAFQLFSSIFGVLPFLKSKVPIYILWSSFLFPEFVWKSSRSSLIIINYYQGFKLKIYPWNYIWLNWFNKNNN